MPSICLINLKRKCLLKINQLMLNFLLLSPGKKSFLSFLLMCQDLTPQATTRQIRQGKIISIMAPFLREVLQPCFSLIIYRIKVFHRRIRFNKTQIAHIFNLPWEVISILIFSPPDPSKLNSIPRRVLRLFPTPIKTTITAIATALLTIFQSIIIISMARLTITIILIF